MDDDAVVAHRSLPDIALCTIILVRKGLYWRFFFEMMLRKLTKKYVLITASSTNNCANAFVPLVVVTN